MNREVGPLEPGEYVRVYLAAYGKRKRRVIEWTQGEILSVEAAGLTIAADPGESDVGSYAAEFYPWSQVGSINRPRHTQPTEESERRWKAEQEKIDAANPQAFIRPDDPNEPF